jgi:hypothetical protein
MHIFNVSMITVKGLKNVSYNVWEELIIQSRYPIKDARPPAARHSPFYMAGALCATRPKINEITKTVYMYIRNSLSLAR